jgi:hypothetical protein
LKVSEEAKCSATSCLVTWTSTVPEITGFTTSYDSSEEAYYINVTGIDFPADLTTT